MARETINISIPASLQEFVKARMAEKGYGNTSEYFRQLVREDKRRADDELLEAALLKGLKGKRTVADDRWWEERHARLAASLRRRKTG